MPVGLVVAGLSFLGLTTLEADTKYSVLAAILFLQGMGMGAAMMPVFSGAMQTLRKAAVARASTTLNIIQQVGASIGTAVMTVLLTQALTARLPTGDGGASAETFGQALPDSARERWAPQMAEAFGQTFFWALVLVIVAFVASLFLPKHRPDPVEEPDEVDGLTAPVPIAP